MISPGSTVSRARSAVLAVSPWRDFLSAAEADWPVVRAVGGRARPRDVLRIETPRKDPAPPNSSVKSWTRQGQHLTDGANWFQPGMTARGEQHFSAYRAFHPAPDRRY